MNENPICLFDSGIGGLTVLKKLINEFPNENYIYLADLARVPFGDKSKEELENIVREIIAWLNKFNPKIIIAACNTSAALIQNCGSIELWDKKLVSIIEPVSKEIADSKFTEVTVWATKFTAENNAYKKAINKFNPNIKVNEISCPKLVPMIEDFSLSSLEKIEVIKEYLEQIPPYSNALIYGCTHYPHLDELIKKQKNILTIDPADSICKHLAIYATPPLIEKSNIEIYTTAQKDKLKMFSKLYLLNDFDVKQIQL